MKRQVIYRRNDRNEKIVKIHERYFLDQRGIGDYPHRHHIVEIPAEHIDQLLAYLNIPDQDKDPVVTGDFIALYPNTLGKLVWANVPTRLREEIKR